VIESRYTDVYRENRTVPIRTLTDDDTVPSGAARRGGLSGEDLVKLRSFDNFWIDTGSMYSNLGAGKPGNQLDLKRFSRVFFGFPAKDLPQNSAIGSVVLKYADVVHPDRHLRFGDNGMDKLDLPIPGVSAPNDYRNLTLRFTRSVQTDGTVMYVLGVAAGAKDRTSWMRRSQQADALFSMGGGSSREFGVF
jgi:hypothetical protein